MIALDALGPDGLYRTRTREQIRDVTGALIAETSQVPRLYVTRAVAAQRKSRPIGAVEREQALTRAADAFATETLGGLDFDRYVELTCGVTGLPRPVALAGAAAVVDGLRRAADAVRPARPLGAVTDWREAPFGGSAVWARRGEVLAVVAPGNAPGVHGAWPQALMLGYRVAVRPSRRDPFTPHRVVLALRASGFRDIDAVYLPTDHRVADDLVAAADLAMVYGGQDVADRYADRPSVLTNGPGRTKILVTADQQWREHLDVIVDSVASLGGTACVNATAVLVDGDAEALARALADGLRDSAAPLPVVSVQRARELAAYLASKAVGGVAILGADQVVDERDDGFAALRPAVHLLRHPDPTVLNVEMPFPCVWVAPWSRADGIAPLRNSLVVTAITGDATLLDDLVAEPTIRGVYRGPVPTHHAAPHIPHDGFLADFLMRNKGFVSG